MLALKYFGPLSTVLVVSTNNASPKIFRYLIDCIGGNWQCGYVSRGVVGAHGYVAVFS